MNKHKIVTSYQSEGGSTQIKSEEVEADLSINIERSIPAGTTVEFICAFDPTKLKSFGLGCKKSPGATGEGGAKLTVKTNSSSTPGNTFLLTAANGRGWSQGDEETNPITVAVTKFFVQNTGTVKADFSFRAALDSTPSSDE